MVLVVVGFPGFAEIVNPRCHLKNAGDGVEFVRGEVTEGLWEVIVGGDELGVPEALMYAGKCLEDHAEPSGTVKDRVWGAKGGGEGLS
jgi:hypothetical protein